ncbi:hypothetical protein BH18ACI2_BH18ACI2_24070 [soil metagenome]
MAENETAPGETTAGAETTRETATAAAPAPEQQQETSAPEQQEAAVPPEEITYHAVEKDGHVTAIWEMQGRKHLRTIDPRSRQGQEILRLYTAEHHE